MVRSFTRTALFITAGLLIWGADFLFTYVFAAVACARGMADITVLGTGLIPLAIVLATLASGAGAAAVAWAGWQRYRPPVHEAREWTTERFVAFTAFAVALLSLVAIVWNALPALLPAAGDCGAPY